MCLHESEGGHLDSYASPGLSLMVKGYYAAPMRSYHSIDQSILLTVVAVMFAEIQCHGGMDSDTS